MRLVELNWVTLDRERFYLAAGPFAKGMCTTSGPAAACESRRCQTPWTPISHSPTAASNVEMLARLLGTA